METQRRRKIIGVAIAVLAVCGGGAAIAATQFGSSSGSSGLGPAPGVSTSAAPDTGSGGGLGGNLYNGGGGGGRGFGGGGGFRGGAGGLTRSLAPAASYLGVTTAALQSDLQDGKTLAQVAKAQRKSVDGLISAMVDAQKTQFDALVKSGRFTAAQAQQFESAMKQRITDMINGTRPTFGGGRGGFGDGGSGSFGGGNGLQPGSPTA